MIWPCVFAAAARWRHREAVALSQRHAEGGRLDTAAQLLQESAASGQLDPHAMVSLPVLYLRQGLLGQAVWVLTSLLAGRQRWRTRVRHKLRHALAYAYAVGDSIESAERIRLAATGLPYASSPLRHVLLCKQGRFAEIARDAEVSMKRARRPRFFRPRPNPLLGWHGQRVVALLRAFSLSRNTASEVSPARMHGLLAAARPTYAAEYDYLQEGWPELTAFTRERFTGTGVATSDHLSPQLPLAVGLPTAFSSNSHPLPLGTQV